MLSLPNTSWRSQGAGSVIKSTTTSYFSVLKTTSSFVDKSLLIQAVINESESMIINGPRRFGKSSNLDMLRRFFDTSQDNRSMFADLKIKNHLDTIEKHCSNYAVLWIDLSWFTVKVNSYENAVIAMRQIVRRTYKQYQFLHSDRGSNLSEFEQKHCERWCCIERHRDFDEAAIGSSFVDLAEILSTYYGKDVVILVDEFDALCNAAMYKVNEETLDEIITFYFKMFSLLVKTEKSTPKSFVFKTVFTGITTVTCNGPSPLNNVPKYAFLENEITADYYGILIEEFYQLLEKPAYLHLSCQQNDAADFYNGYQFKKRKILCTFSVVEYLNRNSNDPSLPLKSYWCDSGALAGFNTVWEREEMQVLLERIINDYSVTVGKFSKIVPRDLCTLSKIFGSTDQSILPDIDIFFVYLQQLGYFNIESSNKEEIIMRIPNEEIRAEFKTILQKCFRLKYKFCDATLKECAEELNRLINSSNEDCIKQIFENFRMKLEKACIEFLISDFLNEATLEHLVFAVLLKTVFRPISQVRIKNASDNRRVNKLDLCCYKKKIGIVVEQKFGPAESSKSALKQIEDKKYCDVFTGRNILNIEKRFCVGIHLSATGDVLSLEYRCI